MKFDYSDTPQIFSHRNKPVPEAPWLLGQQNTPPARRKVAKGDSSPDRLSYFLARGLAVVLSGKVKEFGTTGPLGDIEKGTVGVVVESASKPGRLNACGMDLDRKALFFPHGKVTYHLGVIGLCEAILRYTASSGKVAADLVESYGTLLQILEAEKRLPIDAAQPPSPAAQDQMAKTTAELYYWLYYEDGTKIGKGASAHVRLFQYEKETVPSAFTLWSNFAHVFTDYKAFQKFTTGTPAPAKPAGTLPGASGKKFRGWQYGELKRAVELGMTVSCIGPSSTGKSVLVYEAVRDDLKLPVFTINALGDKTPKDLIGGYAKDGKGDWQFVPGKLLRAAEAAAQHGRAVVFVDEAGLLSEKAQGVFLKCLSDDRRLDLSEFGLEDVSLEKVVFIFAGNFSPEYGANFAILSLLSRQDVVLDFEYMTRDDEIDWLHTETGLPPKVVTVLVDIARETRTRHQSLGKYKYYLDPRGLLAWAKIVADRRTSSPSDRLHLQATAKTWYSKVANLTSTSNADSNEVAELEKIVSDFAKSL